MPFALVILGLVTIVMVHELGHFLAARAVGIRATKFYVFFPPALLKKKIGEVEYGIGSIPLGGFVRLPGMFQPTGRDTHWRLEPTMEHLVRGIDDADLRLNVSSTFRRVATAGDADELGATLAELDAQLAQVARDQTRTVGSFQNASLEAYRRNVQRMRGRLENLIDDCHPRAYWRASLWRRMTVIMAGPAVNIALAFLVLVIYTMFFYPRFEAQFNIDRVVKNSPAAEAGIRKGDVVVDWNGVAGKNEFRAFRDGIVSARDDTVEVKLRRDGETITRDLQRREIDGQKIVGVVFGYDEKSIREVGHERVGLGQATEATLLLMKRVTVGNLQGLGRVIIGKDRDKVSSVVGIVKVAPEIEQAGKLVEYFAVLNLVIGVLNLLPLLPMDGGHLAFGFLEFLRKGRPMPRQAFERASVVGLMLLLALFAIGLGNDLGFSG